MVTQIGEFMQYPEHLKKLAAAYKGKRTTNLTRSQSQEYVDLVACTSFLPTNSSSSQRLYHVEHDLFSVPKCKQCGERSVSWGNHHKPSRYNDYCSVKCAANANEVKTQRQLTNQQKYGVSHYSQTSEFSLEHTGKKIAEITLRKRRETLLDRYGVHAASLIPDAIEKKRQTNIKKYGHTNVLASQMVKDKKQKKYGTCNYTQTPEFKQKRKITMLERYGVEYSGQDPVLLSKRFDTCVARYGTPFVSNSHISNESLKLLADSQWLYDQHHTNQVPLSTIARQLDVDLGTIRHHINKHDIPVVRHHGSYAEREIGEFLTEKGVVFEKNNRTILNGKELDFYVPNQNIAIEYCGLYWHSTAVRNDRNYHYNKMKQCAERGIRLITIFEDEWVHSNNIVKSKLSSILNLDTDDAIYARKCYVQPVSSPIKQEFFNEYHIQGNGPSSVNLGLFHKEHLIACVGLINKRGDYILNRYATSTKVVGGFSKLLSYFCANYEWDTIVTFADQRWSIGHLYQSCGFDLIGILPPDYRYVDLRNIKRIHKFNFRHKNLPNILGDRYNPQLSEVRNCEANGWYRIFNCGLQKWIMKKALI